MHFLSNTLINVLLMFQQTQKHHNHCHNVAVLTKLKKGISVPLNAYLDSQKVSHCQKSTKCSNFNTKTSNLPKGKRCLFHCLLQLGILQSLIY